MYEIQYYNVDKFNILNNEHLYERKETIPKEKVRTSKVAKMRENGTKYFLFR
jgi:hypothetical protein